MEIKSPADIHHDKIKRLKGFSLIEIMISISLLAMIGIISSQALRSGFDTKAVITIQFQNTQRINRIMDQLSRDLAQTYIVSTRDTERQTPNRSGKTIFYFSSGSDPQLKFTTMSHQPIKRDSAESSLVFVAYELRPSKEYLGRTDLYRGVMAQVPENFRELPKMRLIASGVKELKVSAWDGEKFRSDRWDSENGDTKDLLPHMVKFEVAIYGKQPEEKEIETSDEDNEYVIESNTMIYLPYAQTFKELKEGTKNIKFL